MRGKPPGRIDLPNPSSPDIQTGRFESFVRRLLSVKRAGLVTHINNEFGFSVDPLNAFIDPEQLLALGWRRYGGVFSAAAVAAQDFALVIANPPASGVIAIIEVFQLNLTAVGSPRVTLEDNPGLGIPGGVFTCYDSRIARGSPTGTVTSTLTVQVGTLATGFQTGRTVWGVGQVTTASRAQQNPFVLTPGFALVLDSFIPLVAGSAEIIWRERALEPAEGALF